MSRLTTTSLLLIITLLSYGLRVAGLQFGLPFAYHPDEQQYILPAIRVVSGDFQPHAHYNPALYPYLIGFVYTGVYWGLYLTGAFPEFFNIEVAWSPAMIPWTTGLVYLARYTTAATGVLTTLMVYHLGRRAYSRQTGLAAALFFGGTFLPAREAHFAVSDAPVALGVAVTLYCALAIMERGYGRDYLKTGLAFGLATALKYSAGLLIVPLGVAHLLSERYRSADNPWLAAMLNGWRLVMTGLVAVGSYIIASPYTLIEWEGFRANFGENLVSARLGFQGLELDPAGGAVFYLKGMMWGLGWPLGVAILTTILFLLGRHRRVDIFMLTFPMFGFFYMQRQEMYFVRWLMPFVPSVTVLVAEGVQQFSRVVSRQLSHSNLTPGRLTMIVALLLVAPSTYTAIYANYVFSQPDTRTQALHWIEEHIPPGSILAAEVLSPPWGPPLAMPGLEVGPYNLAPVPSGGVAELNWEQYQTWGVDYVIASSFHYRRQLRNKEHQAALTTRLQVLADRAELVKIFQPYYEPYQGFFYHDQVYGPADEALYRHQPGPVIRVYRLPK